MLRTGSTIQAKIVEKYNFGIYLENNGDQILLLTTDMGDSPAESAACLSSLAIGQTIRVKITDHAKKYHVYTSTLKGVGDDSRQRSSTKHR